MTVVTDEMVQALADSVDADGRPLTIVVGADVAVASIRFPVHRSLLVERGTLILMPRDELDQLIDAEREAAG